MHTERLLRLAEGWTHYTQTTVCYSLIEATGQKLETLKMLPLTSQSLKVMLII